MYKASNIMALELIQDNCIEIQLFLEQPYDSDNGNAVVERAQKIEGYMALSGKMVADSKYHFSQVFQSGFMSALKDNVKTPTSTLNKYLDSIVCDYQYLVDWSDRINRTCTHQLEFSRTLISKLKAEMQNFNYQSRVN